ncbi:DUF1643 domain-containing protein [Bacillus paramycoides]|uniref:DUF1643 domain-containing protein n=1 Tax=Bacillus paramycoides TaxID=2026194 RepID=UPI002E1DE6A7|nr:DUF1643 domain-containing protein [Bacillus paramycoides]
MKNSIINSEAKYSEDEERRYSLIRVWNEKKPKAVAILFNPAIATHIKFDKSTFLCMNKAIDNKCGSIEIVNLFSKRSPRKKKLPKKYRVFEQENFDIIKEAVESASFVIVGWGKGGEAMTEQSCFKDLLTEHEKKLYYFGLYEEDNIPKHPSRGFGEKSKLYNYEISK